jgi:amidase
LQLTEGAYSDHHPTVTPPNNPWHADYWPGISSSGSAVATAAGLCYGSLASDTGGSIRWPCAANGLTGLKPSWGRVSRHGVFELAATLDHVGTITRSALDAAAMLGAIAGRDHADPTAVSDSVPDYVAAAEQDVRGLRIGFDARWSSADVDAATQLVLQEAIEVMQVQGAEIIDLPFPDVKQAVADWVPNCAVEAAVAHEATYPARRHEYGPVLAAVLENGRALSGADYQKILLRRQALRGRIASLFESVDLFLMPVHPFPPLTLAMIKTLGEQPELIARLQEFTCPFNMTGHPTLTLPGGFSTSGLPIAFQLVADQLDEAMLIRAGAAFQRVTSWHRRHPSPISWRQS